MLTIDELPDFGNVESGETAMPEGTLSSGELEETAQTYGMYLEWNYIIEMPGKITSAEGGKISEENDHVVTFNLIDLMKDSEPIVVESESGGLPCIGFMVLLVAAAGAFAMRD